jgi:hypothetical protein
VCTCVCRFAMVEETEEDVSILVTTVAARERECVWVCIRANTCTHVLHNYTYT